MQPKKLNNAIEFCKEYDLGEECNQFAKAHPSFPDFWNHCDNSEWMLWLLEATNYRNHDGLLEFFILTRASLKHHPRYSHIQESGENFRKQFEDQRAALEKKVEAGEYDVKYARLVSWSNIWTYARVFAHEAAQDARNNAIWDAGIKARLSGKEEEEEIKVIVDATLDKALKDSLKDQAKLLRELIGNPFSPMIPADFD